MIITPEQKNAPKHDKVLRGITSIWVSVLMKCLFYVWDHVPKTVFRAVRTVPPRERE